VPSAVEPAFRTVPAEQVCLGAGLFANRYSLNVEYLLSLKPENLLHNYYIEAGIGDTRSRALRSTFHGSQGAGDDLHWGWETPGHELRGHFLGHWLSAAARVVATGTNPELRLRLDAVVRELGRCQDENGGEWVFAIPPKYLDRIAAGKKMWAPHYVTHKTLMGLVDAYRYAGSENALAIADRAGQWFHRWTRQFDRAQMDEILDVETGGMLEIWADLYQGTGKDIYLDLIERYRRDRLFDPLLAGIDVLTNAHANTTIPEILGAARAYEVTGEQRWRDIVTAYWRSAVTERGTFCTGGQTSFESWTPPFEFAARRSRYNQEHCTVYNMMRLADFLFRWTGERAYLDYLERNAYNGVLAQQHKTTGMISYYLPFEGGAKKIFGSPTCDFWCCHGSLVQAQSLHSAYIYYLGPSSDVTVAQYIPSTLTTTVDGVGVRIEMLVDGPSAAPRWDVGHEERRAIHQRAGWQVSLRVTAEAPIQMQLKLREPWWLADQASVTVDQAPIDARSVDGFLVLDRTWHENTIEVVLPKRLSADPIPDEPETIAFLDGPIVLAGLCDAENALIGDPQRPDSLLSPDNQPLNTWLPGYRSIGQTRSVRFIPLFEITEEPHAIYFPVLQPK
jgi:uncharacterized protein